MTITMETKMSDDSRDCVRIAINVAPVKPFPLS